MQLNQLAVYLEELARITFSKAATLYIEAHEASWKNATHRQQWANTLDTYTRPAIGSLLHFKALIP